MWRADRDSVSAKTDEDRAMAHVCYGTKFVDRDDARSSLLRGIMDEIKHYVDGSPANFHAFCVVRLARIHEQLMDNPELNEAEYDGLRFRISKWGTKT